MVITTNIISIGRGFFGAIGWRRRIGIPRTQRSERMFIEFKRSNDINDDIHARIKQYTKWFRDNNVKYQYYRNPLWSPVVSGVILKDEDALYFKLTFGLD